MWLSDGETRHTFYTTPASPVDIRYEMTLESVGEMIRDGVLNRWDMDETTGDMETKGCWIFGFEPAGSLQLFRYFAASYEVVP